MCTHNFVKSTERERPLENPKHKKGLILIWILKTRRDITDDIHMEHVGKKNVCFEHDIEYEVAYNGGISLTR